MGCIVLVLALASFVYLALQRLLVFGGGDGGTPSAYPAAADHVSWRGHTFAGDSGSGSSRGPVEHYDLLVVVPSASHELDRRTAIRSSWAQYLTAPSCRRCHENKVRIVFVVGNESKVAASRHEAAEKGDLVVLEDFGQPVYYGQRAEKTMRSLRHAVQHYSFRLLLKCDTDSWVFMDRLLRLLDERQLWDREYLYAGNFHEGRRATPMPFRDHKSYDPWYAGATGFTHYPPHAKGAGYILGRKLAESLSRPEVEAWQLLPNEDVAIGFLTLPLKREVVDIPVSVNPSCEDSEVIDHHVSPAHMYKRWDMYLSVGVPCFYHSGP